MKYFRKMVEQFITVDDNEWGCICAKLKKIEVEKGATIHRSDEVFSDIWFVKSGVSRSYFTDINGNPGTVYQLKSIG